MDWLLIGVIGVIALALLFDFTNGFHDAANSVATVVATRAMPARWAPWFSAFFNFSAFFVVGTAVANTVAKVVKHDAEGVAVVFAALDRGDHLELPHLVRRHAVVVQPRDHRWPGRRRAGCGRTRGDQLGCGPTAVIAIVASPAVAFTVAFLAMVVLARTPAPAEGARRREGVQGPAAGLGRCRVVRPRCQRRPEDDGDHGRALVAGGYIALLPDGNLEIDWWIPLLAYSAIAVGTIWGGWKIIETMGLRITTLRASSGLAANIGAVTAIFGATGMGIPISTTHAAASSVTGSGVASGQGVNLRVVGEMVIAWVITIPSTVVIGWVMFQLTQLPGAAALDGGRCGAVRARSAGSRWAMAKRAARIRCRRRDPHR